MPQDTILDLIARTARVDEQGTKPARIGRGAAAEVFSLDAEGLPDFVLRMHKIGKEFEGHRNNAQLRHHLAKLNTSTTLTSVGECFGEHNFGHPVLAGPELEFCVRQPGCNLHELYQRYKAESTQPGRLSNYEAYTRVLEHMAALKPEAYEQLAKDVNYLTCVGRELDTEGQNLMVSEDGRMHLVDTSPRDVQEGMSQNHADGLKKYFRSFAVFPFLHEHNDASKALVARLRAARETIEQKINEAAAATALPMNASQMRERNDQQPPVPVMRVESTQPGVTLKLSDSPARLREALREAHTRQI